MLGTLEFVGSEHWAPFNFLRAHPWWTFGLLKIIVGAPRQWSCRITKSSWKPYTTKGTSSAKQQAHSSSSWTRWVYDLTYKLFFLFILAVRAGPHSSLYSPYMQVSVVWHVPTEPFLLTFENSIPWSLHYISDTLRVTVSDCLMKVAGHSIEVHCSPHKVRLRGLVYPQLHLYWH